MLDGGPLRTGRPAEKRTVARPEPAPQPEAPRAAEHPRPVHRAPQPHHEAEEKSLLKRLLLPIIAVVAVIIIAVAGWLVWSNSQGSAAPVGAAIDSSKYQAVFFTNGQVYFGKLQAFGSEYMKLTEVFYLQTKEGSTDENPQQTANDSSNNVQLIKLGNEIHGPEDEMIISKDQMLFFENLKADGKVAESINQYKQKN